MSGMHQNAPFDVVDLLRDLGTFDPGWFACLLPAGHRLPLSVGSQLGRPRPCPCGAWASFVTGCALLWVCVASAIGAYAMSLFWMHMVLHLLLIMVVPAFLVLGHPLTVLVEACPAAGAAGGAAGAPLVAGHAGDTGPRPGCWLYAATIVATHLTGFMDQMAEHAWLMTGEQVLYVVAGYLFLLPLLGEEPIRPEPPYLQRLVLLVAAMIPDTVVGIVLMQAGHDPFSVMMGMHPTWALPALADLQVGGALMWAAGDGLMMLLRRGTDDQRPRLPRPPGTDDRPLVGGRAQLDHERTDPRARGGHRDRCAPSSRHEGPWTRLQRDAVPALRRPLERRCSTGVAARWPRTWMTGATDHDHAKYLSQT